MRMMYSNGSLEQTTHTPSRKVGLQVWLLALGMFAIGTDLFIVSGLLTDVGHDLGLSTGLAGQAVTVFAIAYALAAPLLAGVTARIERRTLLVAVLAVFAVGNTVSAVAPNFLVLSIGRVVAAGGAALFAATASAVAARVTAQERHGRALAVVYAGMTTAIALGVPIGNEIGNATSWRWGFGFVTVLAALTAVGLRLALPALSGSGGVTLATRLRAVRIPHARPVLLVTALWVLGTFMVYTYLAALLDRVTDAPTSDRPWLLMLFGVGSFAGVMVGGRVADRFDDLRALAATVAILAVVLFGLGVLLHSVPATAVGLLAWGFVHWITFPLLQHRLLAVGGDRADMLLAGNNSAVYAGQTLAAFVGGLLAAGLLAWLPVIGGAVELVACSVLGYAIWSRRVGTTARDDGHPAGVELHGSEV